MKKKVFILVLFFIHGFLFGKETLHNSSINLSAPKDTVWFIKGFVQDHQKLWTSPLHISNKRFCFWVPVIGASMIAMRNDEKIYAEFKNYQYSHKWADKLSPIITYGGENITVLSVSSMFYLGGILFHDEKAKQTGILSIEALGHAGVIVTIGKLITGRQRPSFGEGIDKWHWFPSSFKQFGDEAQSKYDAFPSGHSIAAWSLATVIAKQYKETKIVPILVYTLATGVALSRVTQDTHWLSDAIIGSAMGYTIGNFVVNKRKYTKWTLTPFTNRNGIMISSLYKF